MKKLFPLMLTQGLSVVFGVLLCYTYFTWSAIQSTTYNVRENGPDWFFFGPGVISNCTCQEVDVSLGDLAHRMQITDPAKIAKIKQWILDNKINRQWNNSPRWPQSTGGDVALAYYISLNGSATTDPDEKMRSCIVSFPLEALPMGITQGELESKLTELKKLLDEN